MYPTTPELYCLLSTAAPLQPISAGGGSNKAQKGVVNKKAKSKKEDEDDDEVEILYFDTK